MGDGQLLDDTGLDKVTASPTGIADLRDQVVAVNGTQLHLGLSTCLAHCLLLQSLILRPESHQKVTSCRMTDVIVAVETF